jgi:enoyl-CoA hydratase/carnithine racemase
MAAWKTAAADHAMVLHSHGTGFCAGQSTGHGATERGSRMSDDQAAEGWSVI